MGAVTRAGFAGGWSTLVTRPRLMFPELRRNWPRLLPTEGSMPVSPSLSVYLIDG